MTYTRGGATALSSREVAVLDFLKRCAGRHPTYQEIADCCGLSSKSQVAGALDGLRKKGWVKHAPAYAARSIELMDPLSATSTHDLIALRDRIDRVLAGRAQ